MRAASILQTEWWKENTSKASREAEQRLAHVGKEAVRMKAAIAEKIDDGMNTARRSMKHAHRAAEDFANDTTHRIKRDPLRAAGLCFGAGVAAGWLLLHRTRR